MPDIFDQLEAQQSQQIPPQPVGTTGGDIFDQLEAQQEGRPVEQLPGVQIPSREQEFGAVRAGEIPLSEVATGAISSFPGSAAELVKTTVHPFTSLENFTETAKSIGTLAEGLISQIIPGEQPSEKVVEAVGEMYAERFGGLENIKRTIRDDPAGFLADLSFIMSAGGAVVSKIAGAGKVGRAAAVVSKVGKALDPLRIAGAVISTPIKMAGKIGEQVMGNMLVGVGAETIQKAFDRPPDFVRALKGKISMEDVLRDAKGGLNTLRDERGAAYLTELVKVKKATTPISMTGIKARMVDKLTKNFRGTVNAAGELDLSNSVFSEAIQKDTQKIYDLVNRWDATPGNSTAIGLDTLKRRLDDFFSPSKNSRSFVTGLRNEVKNEIVKNVPAYSKMTKSYSEASDILNRIEKGLSLGDRVSMDTAIRKLSSVMKENNEFRNKLLGNLEKAAGTDFRAQIAGIKMQKMLPQGLVGRLTDVGIASNILYKGIMATDPVLFAALMATSPRVSAKFLNVLGHGYRGTRGAFRGITSVTPAGFQISRAGLKAQEAQQPVLE